MLNRMCKDDDALLMLTVIFPPKATDVGLQVIVEALGIVESEIEPLLDAVPIYLPFQLIFIVNEKLKLIDLVPSALCEIVVVPEAIV